MGREGYQQPPGFNQNFKDPMVWDPPSPRYDKKLNQYKKKPSQNNVKRNYEKPWKNKAQVSKQQD